MEEISGQKCPVCSKDTLSLMEKVLNIPYFGKSYLFTMQCSSCNYFKTDIEAEQEQAPAQWSVEISGEEDLNIRIVKSSQAVVKIPYVITIEPGETSNGYITNVEGLLNRVRRQIEFAADGEETGKDEKKKAKNLLKKINRTIQGREKLKIIVEDPTGNSLIIAEKATKKAYKPKK